MHKAILASCSKFLSSILLDGRDETTVFLPEVDKEDFHNLVRNLYGEKGTKRPSQELLTLLQISELPEIGEDSASTTLTTCKSLYFYYFFYSVKSFRGIPKVKLIDNFFSLCE